MSIKLSHWIICSSLIFSTAMMVPTHSMGQFKADDAPPVDLVVDVDAFLESFDAGIQLVEDIYQNDVVASLRVQQERIGDMVSVFMDDVHLADFAVENTTTMRIELTEPAQVGSFLKVYNPEGKIVYQSPVLHMTYHRGDVVGTAEYGNQLPDIEDVRFLYNHVVLGGPAPENFDHGDVDDSGKIDINDVMILANFVFDHDSEIKPRCDVLNDGNLLTLNEEVLETEGGQDEGDGNAGKSTPPQPGQNAQPICLDGNPLTKEWFWPDCTECLAGGKKVMVFSIGPRDPNQVPTGANSYFWRVLVCPDGTVKEVGRCVFADGLNSVTYGDGTITHTCKNRDNPEPYEGCMIQECGSVTFKTDLATCEQTVCVDKNGDGVVDLELKKLDEDVIP